MILGVGIDLCEVERVVEALERRAERFRKRICSDRELALGLRLADEASFFAQRFAAKEACAKALGTGITEAVRWRDIEVLAGEHGEPVLHLSGGASRRLTRMGGGAPVKAHVSITVAASFALALVVLEAPGHASR